MIDINTTFHWYPPGTDLMNSTGFSLMPTLIDGIGFNYHIVIIEQLLAGILFVLVLWFSLHLYDRFIRRYLQ